MPASPENAPAPPGAARTLHEIIAEAVRSSGFLCRVDTTRLDISYDVPPLDLRTDEQAGRYDAAVEAVPGVVSDEGQGDGYSFEVESYEFTIESERALLRVLRRYQSKRVPTKEPAHVA